MRVSGDSSDRRGRSEHSAIESGLGPEWQDGSGVHAPPELPGEASQVGQDPIDKGIRRETVDLDDLPPWPGEDGGPDPDADPA